MEQTQRDVVESLVKRHGTGQRPRIETGVRRVASLWREKDGTPADFQSFCEAHYWADPAVRQRAFDRLERNFELLFGHLAALGRELSAPQDLTSFEESPLDAAFAEYDTGAHIEDDLFDNKIAFQVLLNFSSSDLATRNAEGAHWSRQRWAEERLADLFETRVPAELAQEANTASTRAGNYIANYNIHVRSLRLGSSEPLFRDDRKLITHWGLRDEIRAQYAEPDGLPRQEALYSAMCRIVDQTIPQEVIGRGDAVWDSRTNLVDTGSGFRQGTPEGGTRYAHFKNVFDVERKLDAHHPRHPSLMERVFLRRRQIPESETRVLFEKLLGSPLLKEVGAWLAGQLGRKLRPFDIWYTAFHSDKQALRQADLDAEVQRRYPTPEAFQADVAPILRKLGFSEEKAQWLAERIVVDPSRGAGHAYPALHRADKAHLRTRIGTAGMDYKGFNIAIHELGHNVEQVFSCHAMDHYLLSRVPNTAFTEAFAFAFQSRDKMILGLPRKHDEAMDALKEFWQTCEIASVGWVDMELWHWTYAHPDATPAEICAAAQRIACETWNRWWAPVIGVADTPILAIYSHMIDGRLYLPDYALGHLISYQIERHLRTHPLATEMERMCRLGSLTPDVWMRAAVGQGLSVEPLLADVHAALRKA